MLKVRFNGLMARPITPTAHWPDCPAEPFHGQAPTPPSLRRVCLNRQTLPPGRRGTPQQLKDIDINGDAVSFHPSGRDHRTTAQ
jgi:hypothetical protein